MRRDDTMSRRAVLRVGGGLAAGLLPGARRDARAATTGALVSRPIPSSGERLAVVGVGTARRYDVGTTEAERAPLREVLRDLSRLGGKVVDTAPS